jgi:hypothetical protein
MSKNYKAPKDLLYPLQYDPDFETGFCADGRQVVMGLLCPCLVAYFFDANGIWIGKEINPWEYPAPTHPASGRYLLSDAAFISAMDRQTTAFQEKIGFRPGTIRVKSFFDEEYGIGIELLPEHYVDIETSPYIPDEERQNFLESRDDWLENGNFVWWWGKDYYMSAEGEVEST